MGHVVSRWIKAGRLRREAEDIGNTAERMGVDDLACRAFAFAARIQRYEQRWRQRLTVPPENPVPKTRSEAEEAFWAYWDTLSAKQKQQIREMHAPDLCQRIAAITHEIRTLPVTIAHHWQVGAYDLAKAAIARLHRLNTEEHALRNECLNRVKHHLVDYRTGLRS